MAIVSSLFIYPIKSCRGSSVLTLMCGPHGVENDRRFMLVDEQGVFLTQRENPRLGAIVPELRPGGLRVNAPGVDELELSNIAAKPRARQVVRVWDFETEAEDLGDDVAEWFSLAIAQRCRLVRFPDDARREASRTHTERHAELAFADAYPLLVISLESLSELNRRLEHALPMHRFRPNVVVRDCQPFQEDDWQTISMPGSTLDLVKPCVRCKITTLNLDTLEYGKEPLRTLAKFRRTEAGVIFGQNAVPHAPGSIHVGDPVTVVAERPHIRAAREP